MSEETPEKKEIYSPNSLAELEQEHAKALMWKQSLGGVVGYLLLALVLAVIFGPEADFSWNFPTLVIGFGFGQIIGGNRFLKKKGWEGARQEYMQRQLHSAKWMGPMLAASWVVYMLYGSGAWWLSMVVIFCISLVVLKKPGQKKV